MAYHKEVYWDHCSFSCHDFKNCLDLFDFHLFPDDLNLFFAHKNLKYLEQLVNVHLGNIHTWLCANKLSLNIKKTNYVIFHPLQKKLVNNPKLFRNQMALKKEKCVKYIGIYVDSHLNWKIHVHNISKKIKRSIRILSKVRYYVTLKILLQLCYSLKYPFLTYGALLWGNTYTSTLNPLILLQKRVVRIICFAKFDDHSSPLFKSLNLLKFENFIYVTNSLFMYDYYRNVLPHAFTDFFVQVKRKHNYNTRLASKNTYYIATVRTNHGKFSLQFQGPKVWDEINDDLKILSKGAFKGQHSSSFIEKY